MAMREWLPPSLAGSTKKPGFAQQIRINMDNAIAPVRDNAQSSAAAAGFMPPADTCCPNLSFQERVYGCLGCMGLGFVISFLGFLSWWSACHSAQSRMLQPSLCDGSLMHALSPALRAGGKTAQFAVLYTVGNLVSIAGSGYAPAGQ